MGIRVLIYIPSILFVLATKLTPLTRGKYKLRDIKIDRWFWAELFVCIFVPYYLVLLLIIGFITDRETVKSLLKEWFCK